MRNSLKGLKTNKNTPFQAMNEHDFNRITEVVKTLHLFNVQTKMDDDKMLITVPDGIIAMYQLEKLKAVASQYSLVIRSSGQALTITLW